MWAPVGGRRVAEVPHPEGKGEKHVGSESAPASPLAEFQGTAAPREVWPPPAGGTLDCVWATSKCRLGSWKETGCVPHSREGFHIGPGGGCCEGVWPPWGRVFTVFQEQLPTWGV